MSRGKNTAPRVKTVNGAVGRLLAVGSCYDKPGVMFSDAQRWGFYGRVAWRCDRIRTNAYLKPLLRQEPLDVTASAIPAARNG